jgi:tape measure domain-containing protein
MANTLQLIFQVLADTAQAREHISRLGYSVQSLGSSFESMGRKLSIGVTLPLTAFAAVSVKSAISMDALERGLKNVAGSSEEAQKQLVRLKEVGKLPGIGFREAIQGSISLQALGFQAQFAERTMVALAKAISLTGGGKVELQRVLVQLTQMAAKGKVLQQDIRPILESAPVFARAMKEAFGTIDTEKIQGLGITAEQFITRVIEQLEKLPSSIDSPKNAFENFTDTLDRFFVAVAKPFLPLLTQALAELTDWLEKAQEAFTRLSEPMKYAIAAFGALLAAIGPLLFTAGAIISSVGGAIAAIGTIPTAIGTVLGTLAALAAAVGGFIPLIAVVVAAIVGLAAQMAVVGAAWASLAATAYAVWQENIGGIQEKTLAAFNEVRDFVAESLSQIKSSFEQNLPLMRQIAHDVLQAIETFWKEHGERITAVIKYAWEIIKTVVSTGLRIVLNVVHLVLQVLNDDWEGAWETFKVIVGVAIDAVIKILEGLPAAIGSIVLLIGSLVESYRQRFFEAASGLAQRFVDGFTSFINGEGREQMALAVVNAAAALSNPAILAYYAYAGAMAAKARNDAFIASLNNPSVEAGLGKETWRDSNEQWMGVPQPKSAGVSGDGKGDDEQRKKLKEAAEARLTDIKTSLKGFERQYQETLDNIKRAFEQNEIDYQEYAESVKRNEDFILERRRLAAEAEIRELRFIEENDAQRAAKKREIEEGIAQAVSERNKKVAASNDEANNKSKEQLEDESRQWVEHLRRLASMRSKYYDDQIADIREGIESGYVAIGEGFDRISALEGARYDDELLALRESRSRNLITEQEYIDDLEALQYDYTRTIQEETRKRIEAHQREFQPSAPPGFDPSGRGQTPSELGQAIIDEVGLPPPPDFSPWGEAFKFLKNAGMNAIGSLANGMGQLVSNMILGGKVAGQSFGQIAKAAIASVASMATVQAIYELAIGIAALTPWGAAIYGPAIMHFKSAALLGGIALGAMGASALAGGGSGASKDSAAANSFQPTGRGLNSPTSTEESRKIVESRGGTGTQAIGEIRLTITLDDHHLETKLIRVYYGNGNFRAELHRDLNGAAFAP